MKSPLWILNSVLAIVFCATLAYVLLSPRQIPSQISLRPQAIESVREQARKPLDQVFFKTIYEDNDLFGTFVRKEAEAEEIEKIAPPPKPPIPKPVVPTPPPAVSFLEPLKVTVTGIITSTEESDNQVIIADASKQEKLYKVGDKVADAYILRIFKNKIVFIRSNGQQETVYINTAEAQTEIKAMQITEWETVVQKTGENKYSIDSKAFGQRITSLAQFIDILDLTTVFNKGMSIGCRIGKIDKKSLGVALGLQAADVVISVNGIQPTTTVRRVEIYNMMRNLEPNELVNVTLIRQRKQVKQIYTVGTLKRAPTIDDSPFGVITPEIPMGQTKAVATKNDKPVLQIALSDQHEEKKKLQHNTTSFSKPVHELKKRDKQAMAHYGRKSSVLKNIPG